MQIDLDKNLKRLLLGQLILIIFLILLSATLISKNLKDLKNQIKGESEKISYKLLMIDEMVGKLYVAEIQKDKSINPDLIQNRGVSKRNGKQKVKEK